MLQPHRNLCVACLSRSLQACSAPLHPASSSQVQPDTNPAMQVWGVTKNLCCNSRRLLLACTLAKIRIQMCPFFQLMRQAVSPVLHEKN